MKTKKGILLVKDPMLVGVLTEVFTDYLVLVSNIERDIEFYLSPL